MISVALNICPDLTLIYHVVGEHSQQTWPGGSHHRSPGYIQGALSRGVAEEAASGRVCIKTNT